MRRSPAEAKKKTKHQQTVWVSAVSRPPWKRIALTASATPEIRYVLVIMMRRPSVSNRVPSSSGPARLPMAKAMK